MGEMKTWVTPEVEVQTFQANEYVSICYAGSSDIGILDNVDLENLFYIGDDGGHNTFSPSKITSDPIAETANSGKVYTLYLDGIFGDYQVGQLFIDKDKKIHVISFQLGEDIDWNSNVYRDNTQWS